MINDMFNLTLKWIYFFNGEGNYLIIFLISLLFLIYLKTYKNNKYFLLYNTCLVLIIILNPIAVKILSKIMGENVYWRVFWILPITIVIPFVATLVTVNSKKYLKYLIGILLIVIFITNGKYIFTSNNFAEAENIYKLPSESIQVCEIIKSDTKVVFPPELTPYIRQYDSSIKMLFGRSASFEEAKLVYRNFLTDVLNVGLISNTAINFDCEFIVYSREKELDGKFSDYGFDKVGETKKYIILKREV